MYRRIPALSALMLLLLVLAGCVAQVPISPQASPPGVTVEEPTDGEQAVCEPGADQVLVRNEAAGYCFLVPAGYEFKLFEETGDLVVLAPATSQGHRERLFVEQQPALGRSLTQVADRVLTDYALPGMDVTGPSTITVGDVQATVIGGLPGQDLNRRLLAVHGGRLYQMTFVPDDPQMGQAFEEMEALYAAVVDSLAFIPATASLQPFANGQESGYPVDAALAWERRLPGDGAEAQCQRLAITADGATWAGSCQAVEVESGDAPYQWAEILNRFAPFVYRGGEWDLTFAGQGTIYHPVWQRALGAWAEASYGETMGGVSATTRTALSWWVGEVEGEAGMCKHLIVLSHGYAYANIEPCGGGEARTLAEGWLETAEMEAFDGWLSTLAPTYAEDNYLDGRGEGEMGPEGLIELAAFSEHIYMRLTE